MNSIQYTKLSRRVKDKLLLIEDVMGIIVPVHCTDGQWVSDYILRRNLDKLILSESVGWYNVC